MDSLSGMEVFVQVAETLSFTGAGRQLGISSSAVGKSIARMEERLAVRLFHRSTRSIKLTAEGALFLQRCRSILDEIDAAQSELSESAGEPRGRLRVSLPPLNGLLLPVLNGFMQQYPQIAVDVDLSERIVDIVEEGFDLVIRTGPQRDSRLGCRELWRCKQVLVAAPSYLALHGVPATAADLGRHACLLHKFTSTGTLERWPVHCAGVCLPETLTSTTIEAVAYMAEQGRGIAFLPEFMIGEALRDGRLQVVLPGEAEETLTFWMLWPSSRHGALKLRAFTDYLTAQAPFGTI